MNDFTKEELELILDGFPGTMYKEYMPLIDKIQSMIDNYSEHKWCPNPNCRLSIHPSNVECMK